MPRAQPAPAAPCSKPSLLLIKFRLWENRVMQSHGHWGQTMKFQGISHGVNGIWSRSQFS